MYKKIICVLLLSACLFGMIGCSEKKNAGTKDDFVIGVVTKSKNSEYWMSVCAGLEKAAEDKNVSVVILSPDTETDKEIQKRMIQDFLKMDVDALAVSPIDSYDNQDYAAEAAKLGIPVYSYDTPVRDVKMPYIGINNEKAGYELARVMAEKMGHRGNIAVISGSRSQASHDERVIGFEDYMSTEQDMCIEVTKSGYSNLRVPKQEMDKIQEDYPDLDAIMTTSAVTALGLTEATAGTGIAIASVDDQEDAIRAVEDGTITALAAQPSYDIGYETVTYIVNDRDGVSQENEKILDTYIVTKENVKEYEDLKK